MPEGDTIFRTAEVLRRTLLGGVIRRAGSQPALGPDLLAPGFDAAQADEVVRRLQADPDRPLGEALLDQRVMAGIGNVYKSEIAFLEGLDPWAPVRAVDDDASLHLVSTARRLLSANVGGGWRVTTGTPAPGRSLWVYGRAWRPCRRCATAIRGRRQGEQARMTYWCPRCQAGDPATPWPVCVPPPIFTVR